MIRLLIKKTKTLTPQFKTRVSVGSEAACVRSVCACPIIIQNPGASDKRSGAGHRTSGAQRSRTCAAPPGARRRGFSRGCGAPPRGAGSSLTRFRLGFAFFSSSRNNVNSNTRQLPELTETERDTEFETHVPRGERESCAASRR